MSTAARVAERKRLHPELYCPHCLWMTGGGCCPRHGGPAWTPEREASARVASRGETAQPQLNAEQRRRVRELVQDEGESRASAVAWVLAFEPAGAS